MVLNSLLPPGTTSKASYSYSYMHTCPCTIFVVGIVSKETGSASMGNSNTITGDNQTN